MDSHTQELLERIARALEARLTISPPPCFGGAEAFVWEAESLSLTPVAQVAAIPLSLLKGVGHVSAQLLENTHRFANGLPANNTLLWGARGMGKSALVKAVHVEVRRTCPNRLILVEIHREDIATLPVLLRHLRTAGDMRFIVFCDDLSFEAEDQSYKSLKAVLDGGIEGRPANVVFYATSNRRHLLPRDMMENERSSAINPHEAVEEKVSLSDRFGLWLGFHKCSQSDYLEMCRSYAAHFSLADGPTMEAAALEWAATRGSRSGRVAWQFIQDFAGRSGKTLQS